MKQAKKKRRTRTILTGDYSSPKCKAVVKFRSGLELQYCVELDQDPEVIQFEYETLIIPYKRKITNSRVSKYIPDFIVWMKDGTVKIVEIKPYSKLKNKVVQTKAEWATEWCEKKGFVYEFVTEKSLKITRQQAILIFENNIKCQTQLASEVRNLKMLY